MSRPSTHPLPTGLGVLVAAALLAGCGADGGAGPAGADDVGHIHSLDVDPSDDTLYVAGHQGLFALGADGLTRVGDGMQDTMSFTIAAPDRFLISGHPGPDAGGPPHLGLAESTDSGRTWATLSLEGQADFHVLEAAGDRVYGVDSQSGRLMATDDGEQWRSLGTLPAADVAADPEDPGTVLLTGGDGALVRLAASGEPEVVQSAPPVVLLDWVDAGLLVGAGPEGTVHRSSDGGRTWEETGTLPSAPHALAATANAWYAATEDGVLVSEDEGSTWSEVSAG